MLQEMEFLTVHHTHLYSRGGDKVFIIPDNPKTQAQMFTFPPFFNQDMEVVRVPNFAWFRRFLPIRSSLSFQNCESMPYLDPSDSVRIEPDLGVATLVAMPGK